MLAQARARRSPTGFLSRPVLYTRVVCHRAPCHLLYTYRDSPYKRSRMGRGNDRSPPSKPAVDRAHVHGRAGRREVGGARGGARAGADPGASGVRGVGCDLGKNCHSTLPLSVVNCHALGVHTVILRSLRSSLVEMAASPLATMTPGDQPLQIARQPRPGARRHETPPPFV